MNNKEKKQLEEEARGWDSRQLNPRNWEDTPEAVPNAGASTLISLRIPNRLLMLLREFARRRGVGYQVLLKQWLDERVHHEAETFSTKAATDILSACRRQARAYNLIPASGKRAA